MFRNVGEMYTSKCRREEGKETGTHNDVTLRVVVSKKEGRDEANNLMRAKEKNVQRWLCRPRLRLGEVRFR